MARRALLLCATRERRWQQVGSGRWLKSGRLNVRWVFFPRVFERSPANQLQKR